MKSKLSLSQIQPDAARSWLTASDEPRRELSSAPSAPSRVGPPWLPGLSSVLFRSSFCGEINDPSAIGALLSLEGPNDGIEIVPVFCRNRGSDCADFLDDRVFCHALSAAPSDDIHFPKCCASKS